MMADVVRLVNDFGNQSTEFAIIIAASLHRQGLASTMVNFMIDIARQQGWKPCGYRRWRRTR